MRGHEIDHVLLNRQRVDILSQFCPVRIDVVAGQNAEHCSQPADIRIYFFQSKLPEAVVADGLHIRFCFRGQLNLFHLLLWP
ncbi:hypothetical protein [Cedecea colo]|uniref:hypothetical protein n=1 Tax=Cedecea colo TaxID=2552946 RepID=UPI0014302892|nr:hypothetical protein [Cedecea colo]